MTLYQVMADSLVLDAYRDLAKVEQFEMRWALAMLIGMFLLWTLAIGSKDRFNIRVMFAVLVLANIHFYFQVVQAKKATRATAVYAAEKIAELREKWHEDR